MAVAAGAHYPMVNDTPASLCLGDVVSIGYKGSSVASKRSLVGSLDFQLCAILPHSFSRPDYV